MSRLSGLKAYAQNSIKEEHTKSKEEIFAEFQPKILAIARRMAKKIPPNVPLAVEDLASYGAIGLLEAIDRFDPTRNNQFNTFADYRIRGAMFDALRSFDPMSRHRREQARDINEAEDVLFQKLGRTPEPSEIAHELGITLAEFFQRKKNTSNVTTLSTLGRGDGEEEISLIETLVDHASINALDLVLDDEFRRSVRQILEDLPEKQNQCILLYYGRNLNLTEVAEVFGVTPSRISQILTKAKKDLRERLVDLAIDKGYEV